MNLKKILKHEPDVEVDRQNEIKDRQEQAKKKDIKRRLDLLQTELEVMQRRA